MANKGKRKLEEAGSSIDPMAAKLTLIKDSLSKNANEVLKKWVSKIESHPPNTKEMMEFLLDVMENPKEGVEVAKLYGILLRRIQYIPISRFMKDFADVARRVKEELDGNNFYLVVTCSMWAALPEENKSNYFMSILFLCMHTELMNNFIDFACIDRAIFPVHGSLEGDTDFALVYIDDVSFTGTQAARTLYIPPYGADAARKVIYAPIYASDMALKSVKEDVEHLTFITSEFTLSPFNTRDITEEYYQRRGTLEKPRVLKVLAKLGLESHEADKTKFLMYTDIKVPDSLSIFPKALFCLKTGGLTYSVVTGKHPDEKECRDKEGIVEDGKVLDTVYKSREWLDFAQELNNGV